MRKQLAVSIAAATLGLTLAAPARADITGSIDATITLEAGCIINGQTLSDGAGGADFGTIDFGTQNTLFSEADGELLSGGGALRIQCSPGIVPTLSFKAGENDGSGAGPGAHAMAHASSPGHYVTYNLYSDAGRSTVIPVGGSVTLAATGAEQQIDIYARAFGEPGLVTGAYSDTVTVVLEL
ncbi:MAG: spore coat protein U domain-containing protein [Sphingopyxis terrae]|nr:spore coat protein U domain-containing protein [Sphingopyxis terrae]